MNPVKTDSRPDPILTLVDHYLSIHGKRIWPSERAEIVHIARGQKGVEVAQMACRSPETIRARRKRIYRKLHVSGAMELQSKLLQFALDTPF